jgi:hypothetical protein
MTRFHEVELKFERPVNEMGGISRDHRNRYNKRMEKVRFTIKYIW